MPDPAPLWISVSASAIRTLPFGRYHLANALARFASGPFLARLPRDLGGASFICNLDDAIAREVCFTGRYEPQETQIARSLLQPGMVAVDAGANWGYFSLVCAHLVGESGRVIALEPHPRLASMLEENVSANDLSQVEVLRLAAASEAGIRPFVGFDERQGNWGLSRLARNADPVEFECAALAIDGLMEQMRVPRVDLLKIDIEGAEADAVRGMIAGLGRHQYRYVILECHPAALAAAGASVDSCLEPFQRAGYRGWHIDHSIAMHRRAAAGAVPVQELLTPVDADRLAADPWPHLLWAAPGASLPA
jgi:FkbM family methyltransferase